MIALAATAPRIDPPREPDTLADLLEQWRLDAEDATPAGALRIAGCMADLRALMHRWEARERHARTLARTAPDVLDGEG